MKTLSNRQIETERLKFDYWGIFFKHVAGKLDVVLLPSPRDLNLTRFDYSPNIEGFHYSCTITVKNWIGVKVYLCGDSPDQNKARYDFIEEKCRNQIDAIKSKAIEWKRLDDKKYSCIIVKLEADISDKTDWPRQMEWMYDTLMELHKIVKPYYGDIRGI